MTKVILDTNMLLATEQFNLDLFNELDRVIEKKYSILVPKSIIKEIKNIKEKGSGENKRAASIALKLIKNKEKIDTEKEGDEAIIEAANKHEAIVATNDSELIRRLKNNNIPVVFLRQKSHLKKN